MSDVEQQLVVRAARLADVPALVELLRELFSVERDFAFDAYKQSKGLRLLLSRGDSACAFVAELRGQVVGMATAQFLVSTAEGGDCALIEDVVVSAPKRGLGIGPRLLEEIEQCCRARGVSRLQLMADKTNDEGLAFYHREGWATTRMGVLRKYVSGDQFEEE
jgi:GNAT superfamily N-acetyltransferase